jgi:hypothetical protein
LPTVTLTIAEAVAGRCQRYNLDYEPTKPDQLVRGADVHEAYHILSKTDTRRNHQASNDPTIKEELIVAIYQAVLSRFEPLIDGEERPESYKPTNYRENLNQSEVSAYIRQTQAQLEHLFSMACDGNASIEEDNQRLTFRTPLIRGGIYASYRPVPEHVIDYHQVRALFIRENMEKALEGKTLAETTYGEFSRLTLGQCKTRLVHGQTMDFQTWQEAVLTPFRQQKGLENGALLEGYMEEIVARELAEAHAFIDALQR